MGGILGMLGGGALNTVMDLFTANKDRQFNRDMMREQNDTNLRNNKELTQYNKEQQLDLWQKTNFKAQVDEMEKAGLSVGMMYGMGGGGGTTANVATGSNTGSGTNYSSKRSPLDITNMIATKQAIETQEAQEDLIRAQTNKTNVEAEKIGGVDTTESQARTKNLLQEVLEKQTSMENRMDYIAEQTKQAISETETKANEANISTETKNAQIKTIKENAIAATLGNVLLRKDANLKDVQVQEALARINKMATDIEQNARSLDQKDLEIKINKFSEEMKANYPSIMNTAGKGLNDLFKTIWKLADYGTIKDEVK